jgi:hypothetical protein
MIVRLHVAFKAPVHGIIFQQVGERLIVRQVIDCNDFYIGVFEEIAEGQATNTAEAVDSNAFFCHDKFWLCNEIKAYLRWQVIPGEGGFSAGAKLQKLTRYISFTAVLFKKKPDLL